MAQGVVLFRICPPSASSLLDLAGAKAPAFFLFITYGMLLITSAVFERILLTAGAALSRLWEGLTGLRGATTRASGVFSFSTYNGIVLALFCNLFLP